MNWKSTESGPDHIAILGDGNGEYKYQIGKEHTEYYRTGEHIFANDNIIDALVTNVERGIYRLYDHAEDSREAITTLLTEASGTGTERRVGAQDDTQPPAGLDTQADDAARRSQDQDAAVMKIIKIFQYPQLMGVGRLPTTLPLCRETIQQGPSELEGAAVSEGASSSGTAGKKVGTTGVLRGRRRR